MRAITYIGLLMLCACGGQPKPQLEVPAGPLPELEVPAELVVPLDLVPADREVWVPVDRSDHATARHGQGDHGPASHRKRTADGRNREVW